MLEWIAIGFGLAGIWFGIRRWRREQKWYSAWHSVESENADLRHDIDRLMDGLNACENSKQENSSDE